MRGYTREQCYRLATGSHHFLLKVVAVTCNRFFIFVQMPSLFLLQTVYSSVHTLKRINKQTHTHHPSLSRPWHVSLSPAWCSLLVCLCFNKTHQPITTKLPLETTVNLSDFINILVLATLLGLSSVYNTM